MSEVEVFPEVDRSRHARQLLLPELGFEGQQRLASARVSFPAEFEPRSRAVAADYLTRAGVASAGDTATGPALTPPVVLAADVARCAADPALEACAAYLLGALSAVEAIKQAAGVGVARSVAELARGLSDAESPRGSDAQPASRGLGAR